MAKKIKTILSRYKMFQVDEKNLYKSEIEQFFLQLSLLSKFSTQIGL